MQEPTELVRLLHRTMQTLPRCTMQFHPEHRECGRIATAEVRIDDELAESCDLCLAFQPKDVAAAWTSLPYASAVRTGGLVIERLLAGELTFEEATPEVVAATTVLLAALPPCPVGLGVPCARCNYSCPHTVMMLEAELRRATGINSRAALA